MKTLIIVESPAKAKKIQGYFKNNQTIVKSSFGHIIDLPKISGAPSLCLYILKCDPISLIINCLSLYDL